MEHVTTAIRLSGILALLGTMVYAIGDVLLLASKASLENYPKLKPYANLLSENSQPVIANMIASHRKVLMFSYAPVLILIFVASILYSILVASGDTAFPKWMAAK